MTYTLSSPLSCAKYIYLHAYFICRRFSIHNLFVNTMIQLFIRLFLCCYFCFFALTIFAQDTVLVQQFIIPIQAGSDDVEQQADGSIYVESTELEMTYDIGNAVGQAVGLHFQNIEISSGTTIESAYIQFHVDEVNSGNCNLQIYAENEGNCLLYTSPSPRDS